MELHPCHRTGRAVYARCVTDGDLASLVRDRAARLFARDEAHLVDPARLVHLERLAPVAGRTSQTRSG